MTKFKEYCEKSNYEVGKELILVKQEIAYLQDKKEMLETILKSRQVSEGE
jgi:hypothetical protein